LYQVSRFNQLLLRLGIRGCRQAPFRSPFSALASRPAVTEKGAAGAAQKENRFPAESCKVARQV
jgi:hypothetical protein